MALRGKKPADVATRLKFMMFGPAGIGKTVAAIQMPKPYIIDTEAGTTHYGDMIEKAEGSVFQSNDLAEVVAEVKALMTEKHDYRTLVIDSFTPLYETELERGERAVGSEFGRHYGYANKTSKRLFNLLSMLDMNVVVTAHAKNEYGDGLKVIGSTFDGWKKLDYLFDLVFFLERRGQKRTAVVRKTRLAQFPDQDSFEWSFEALASRYGADKLEREATPVAFATHAQLERFGRLCEALTKDTEKVMEQVEKSGAASLEEMPAETIAKWIAAMEKELKAKNLLLEVE